MSKLIPIIPIIFICILSFIKYEEDKICSDFNIWPEPEVEQWDSWTRKYWTCDDTLNLSKDQRDCFFKGESCPDHVIELKHSCKLPLNEQEKENCLLQAAAIKKTDFQKSFTLKYLLCSSGTEKINRLSCYLLHPMFLEQMHNDEFLLSICKDYNFKTLCRELATYNLAKEDINDKYHNLLKETCEQNDGKSCHLMEYFKKVKQ